MKINYGDFLNKDSVHWKSIKLDTSQYTVALKGAKTIHLRTTYGIKGKYKIISPYLYSSPFFAFRQQKSNIITGFISKIDVLKKGLDKYPTEESKKVEESYMFASSLLALEDHILEQFDKSPQKAQILAEVGIPNHSGVFNMSYKCPIKKHYLFHSLMENPRIVKDDNNPNQDPDSIGQIDITKSPVLSIKLWTSENKPQKAINSSSSSSSSENQFEQNVNDSYSSDYIRTDDGLYLFTNVLDISKGLDNQKVLSDWNTIEKLVVYDKLKRDKALFKMLGLFELLAPTLYISDKEIRILLKASALKVFHIMATQNRNDQSVTLEQYQAYINFVQNDPDLLNQFEIVDDVLPTNVPPINNDKKENNNINNNKNADTIGSKRKKSNDDDHDNDDDDNDDDDDDNDDDKNDNGDNEKKDKDDKNDNFVNVSKKPYLKKQKISN